MCLLFRAIKQDSSTILFYQGCGTHTLLMEDDDFFPFGGRSSPYIVVCTDTGNHLEIYDDELNFLAEFHPNPFGGSNYELLWLFV